MATWCGTPEKRCNLCGKPLERVFVDGRVLGRTCWAIFCLECHDKHGVGLGVGLGQRYDRSEDAAGRVEWVKTAG